VVKAGNSVEKKPVKKLTMVEEHMKINLTRDYQKFKRIRGNREVIERHVKDLLRVMEEHPIMIPIIVNAKMEVIDGQHRLEAYKRLKFPVPYINGGNLQLEDVQAINASARPWTPIDYARSYVELGNQHYKTYIEFRQKHDLGHDAAVWLLTGQELHRMRQTFNSGQFRVSDLEEAERRMEFLRQLKGTYPHWRDVTFIKALQVATNRVGFTMERFMKRALENPDLFRYSSTIDETLLMIEEIFNRGEHKKIPIRYGQAIKKTKGYGLEQSAEVSRRTREKGGDHRADKN
jgi:hypothetical protein